MSELVWRHPVWICLSVSCLSLDIKERKEGHLGCYWPSVYMLVYTVSVIASFPIRDKFAFLFYFQCVSYSPLQTSQWHWYWLITHFSGSVILSTNWMIFERCLNGNGWKSNNTTVSWTSMHQSDTNIERVFHLGVVFPSLPNWTEAYECQWVLQVI